MPYSPMDCRPPDPALTGVGCWKQRCRGEAIHLPFVQVLFGSHGNSGLSRRFYRRLFLCLARQPAKNSYRTSSVPRENAGRLRLSKKSEGLLRQFGLRFALRLGVRLRRPFDARYARGVFPRRTRRREKRVILFHRCGGETLRGFFDRLKRPA